MASMNRNKNTFLIINFWFSEFFILMLSNYYRWMEEWNLIGVLITLLILSVNIQYCFFHVMKLHERSFCWYHILLIELSFVFSNIYIVFANMFWFIRSYQVNFVFIIILAILLCPMVIVNSKVLNKQS